MTDTSRLEIDRTILNNRVRWSGLAVIAAYAYM
jgi:hypothetical protein